MKLTEINRWKKKLFYTGLFLLVYMVGVTNLDATVGCLRNDSDNFKCRTWDLLGRNENSLINGYHSALWLMNISLLLVIWSVMWL